MRLSRRGAAVSSLLVTAALLPAVSPVDHAHALTTKRVIGCEGPLTGANAKFGINACRAVELAVRQANQRGVLPYHLGVTRFDDQGDPAKAPAAATEAINDVLVTAVVGPDFSGTALATGKRYSDAHLLVVTPSATYPPLAEQRFRTFFQAIASDTVEGAAAGRYLARLPDTHRVAAVDDLSAYGTDVRRAAQRTLRAADVAQFAGHLDGTSAKYPQYLTLARRIEKRGANAVFYGGYDAGAGSLAKALHQVGFTGTFLTDDGARDVGFIARAGKAAAASAQFTSPYVSEVAYDRAKQFIQAYRTAFSSTPSEPAAEAYDTTKSIIATLATLPVSPTRASVVSAYRTVDVKGIANRISFDHSQRLRHGRVFLYEVEGDDIVQLRRLPT